MSTVSKTCDQSRAGGKLEPPARILSRPVRPAQVGRPANPCRAAYQRRQHKAVVWDRLNGQPHTGFCGRTHTCAPRESDDADARVCHHPMPCQNNLRQRCHLVELPEGLGGARAWPKQVQDSLARAASPTTAGRDRGHLKVSSDSVPAADDKFCDRLH